MRLARRGDKKRNGRDDAQCAVQPPSIGSTAPVIEAASALHRNAVNAATCSTVTNCLVGCAASSTSRTTASSLMPRALRGGRDLLLHQRRQHITRAHRVDRDAGFGDFERHRLGEAGDAVFGRDVGALERAGHQCMRRGHVDDAAEAVALHRRQRQARGVKRRTQVDRQDRVPLVERKRIDRRHVLDAGVVDQQVDRAEFADRTRHHGFDRIGAAHVGAVVHHVDAVRLAISARSCAI